MMQRIKDFGQSDHSYRNYEDTKKIRSILKPHLKSLSSAVVLSETLYLFFNFRESTRLKLPLNLYCVDTHAAHVPRWPR